MGTGRSATTRATTINEIRIVRAIRIDSILSDDESRNNVLSESKKGDPG